MKKRVLSVLLAVMLLVASFATVSAAEATGINAPASVEVGEEIVVKIVIPATDATVSAIQTEVIFDNTVVELVKSEESDFAWINAGTKTSGGVGDIDTDNKAGVWTTAYASGDGNVFDLSKGIVWTGTFKVLDEKTTEVTFKAGDNFFATVINDETGMQEDEYLDLEATVRTATVKINVPCAHDWKETAAKVEPTCDEAGKEAVYTCSICGATKGGEEIAALGHKWEVKEKVESTCKDAGYVIEKCSVCGEEKTTALELADHTWGEWVLDEEGTTETRTCEVCGATESREYNPETGDTMMSVLFLAMAATFVVAIAKVNKARKNA